MDNRFDLRVAVIACVASLALSGVSAQTPPSRNSVRAGANLDGPLKTRICPNAAECTLRVRAAHVALDEDDDRDEGCHITTRIGALLHKSTEKVTWKLVPLSTIPARGFRFKFPGVVIDDGSDPGMGIAGTHFEVPVVSMDGKEVTAALKTGTFVNGFTYSIYLKWEKDNGTSGECKAYDPIIVTQDH